MALDIVVEKSILTDRGEEGLGELRTLQLGARVGDFHPRGILRGAAVPKILFRMIMSGLCGRATSTISSLVTPLHLPMLRGLPHFPPLLTAIMNFLSSSATPSQFESARSGPPEFRLCAGPSAPASVVPRERHAPHPLGQDAHDEIILDEGSAFRFRTGADGLLIELTPMRGAWAALQRGGD